MTGTTTRPQRTAFDREFRAVAFEKSLAVRLAFKDEPVVGDLALLLLYDERLTVEDRAWLRGKAQDTVDEMKRRKAGRS